MAGKSFGRALGADGKYQQKLLGVCYTPLEHKPRLETTSRKTIAGYDAVMTDLQHEPCALKCQRCNQFISPSHPSQSIKQHDQRCRVPAQPEEDLMMDEEGPEAGGPPQKRKAPQLPVAPYIPTSKQQQDCHKDLVRFVIDAEIPFKKMDNPFLYGSLR